MDRCRGQVKTIAINDNYLIAPWADLHYHCDAKWLKWHKDDPRFMGFAGLRVTQDKESIDIDPTLIKVDGEAKYGLSEDPLRIHFGSNSGFQCLNLALHLGAAQILLLGFDMQIGADGRSHWFGDHPDRIRSGYAAWLDNFKLAAKQFNLLGVEVINCSPSSALTCFRMAPIEAVL